jgi:ElaB/YqjD/DUF883 family membrane-anchored ribosome-binding protein
MQSTFEDDFLALLAISPRVQDAIRALILVPKTPTGANATRDADIIQRVNAGEPRRTLAAEYGVSIDRINQIMRGNTVTQPRTKAQAPQTKPLTDREKEILRDWGAYAVDEETSLREQNPQLAAEVYQDIYENADLHATAKRFNITAIMAEKLYFAEEARRESAMKKEK